MVRIKIFRLYEFYRLDKLSSLIVYWGGSLAKGQICLSQILHLRDHLCVTGNIDSVPSEIENISVTLSPGGKAFRHLFYVQYCRHRQLDIYSLIIVFASWGVCRAFYIFPRYQAGHK